MTSLKISAVMCTMLFMLVFTACTKDKNPAIISPVIVVEDPSNRSLTKKTLPEIRAIIAGSWEIKYDISDGVAGFIKTLHSNDYLTFLANDTLKRELNGNIVLYEKPTSIDKVLINAAFMQDSIYLFNFPLIAWGFSEVKNDTLVMYNGSQVRNFLIKR